MRSGARSMAAPVVATALVALAVTAFAHVSLTPERTEGVVPAPYGHDGEQRTLPGGREVAPAGTQIGVRIFPLRVAPAPDGIHALVTSNGMTRTCLSWVNLEAAFVKQTICPLNTDGGTTQPGAGVPRGMSFGVAYVALPGTEGGPLGRPLSLGEASLRFGRAGTRAARGRVRRSGHAVSAGRRPDHADAAPQRGRRP